MPGATRHLGPRLVASSHRTRKPGGRPAVHSRAAQGTRHGKCLGVRCDVPTVRTE